MYILYVNGWEELRTKSFNRIKKTVNNLKNCKNFAGVNMQFTVFLGDESIFKATAESIEYVYDNSCNFYK